MTLGEDGITRREVGPGIAGDLSRLHPRTYSEKDVRRMRGALGTNLQAHSLDYYYENMAILLHRLAT